MSDHGENEENVIGLDNEGDDAGNDESILDTATGELTYRGGYIGDHIDRRLITSVIFAEDVELVEDAYYDDYLGQEFGVFHGCIRLVTVRINAACKVIGTMSFYQCRSIVSVHMPHGSCVVIRSSAFSLCINIVSIEIPGSCIHMGLAAFDTCVSLRTVNFAKAHLIEFERSLFENCRVLTTINLPALAAIPDACFKDCHLLAPFKLPDSCTVEGEDDSFDGCDLIVAAALKMSITVEQLLRYRYRLPRFIISSFIAFNRCDMLKAQTGSDGIGLNEDRDMMVLMYRRIETADLWRKILGYVRPADV